MTVMKASDLLKAADIHANRPAANTVPTGALYSCTTHNLIYRSDGSSWSTWATLSGTTPPASGVAFTPTGGVASTDVQAAIAELDTEKATTAALAAHTGDTANPHAVTKAQVGLGNVDNTSDMNKPVSTAQAAALQPIDPDLTAIAALVSAANKMPYATGAGAWSLADLTAFARTLLDDTDAATMRATLGLGTAATLDAPASGNASAGQVVKGNDTRLGGAAFHGAKAVAASQNIASGSAVALALATEEYDTDGIHDNVTNNTRFTVPAGMAGVWRFTGTVNYASSGTGATRGLFFFLNGVNTQENGGLRVNGLTSLAMPLTSAVDLLLSAGDYVELAGFQSSGGSLAVTGKLSCQYLGAP